MNGVRLTLRCLREDLKIELPPVDSLLEEVDHRLLAKACERFADADTPQERIAAVDDQVLFKVKVQRWRGAVWLEPNLPWLVAAGWRESGSGDDFYAALASDGKTARARYNADNRATLTTDTYTSYLLPTHDDRLRHRLETATRFVRRLETLVPDLVRQSLRDGHERTADLGAFDLGIQVRAERGHETYVAIRIRGSVAPNLVPVILDIVPGCDRTGWYPEAGLPDRLLRPNEQAWSNIMDTAAAVALLDRD